MAFRLLVLGGTKFLGRHVVEAALARGHDVTTLTRGRTEPGLFAGRVTSVHGDRAVDLGRLGAGSWDAVVDTSGYVPRVVRASVEALAARTGVYAFVSSISVYPDFALGAAGEDDPVGVLKDPATEVIDGETYGPLKAACEAVVRERIGTRALIVRPGLIVGPHDPTDRFTYWVRRADDGGAALAPGDGTRLVQVIDARDLAAWIVAACERGTSGTFNATGEPVAIGGVLDACAAAAGGRVRWQWVPEAALLAAGVQPWVDLPLWLAGSDQTVPIARARAAGLSLRSVAETVRDTLVWDRTRRDAPLAAGVGRSREAELVAAAGVLG
jgi:2'-hydroxyisoflavone reductase